MLVSRLSESKAIIPCDVMLLFYMQIDHVIIVVGKIIGTVCAAARIELIGALFLCYTKTRSA